MVWMRVALCVLLLGLGSACGTDPDGKETRPHVLLVLVDTLRFDRVGAYGADRPTTPNIDLVANSGVRFERAYSPAPWTKPAAASILTGLYPSTHGATSVPARISDEATTLAEILSAEGYATLGVVSGSNVSSVYGFDRGFDHWDESQIRGGEAFTSLQVTDRALAFAREAIRSGRRFFLFVHYFDPHYIYRHHPKVGFSPERAGRLDGSEGIHELRRIGRDASAEEIEFLRARYDEEIRVTDATFGRLMEGLEALGVAQQNLILVITADHGEEILERGWLGHTRTLYEELLRVPLIVRAPARVRPGHVVEQPVSTVALTPTILDWLGLEAPDDPLQAESLAALAAGGQEDPAAQVLGEVDFETGGPAQTVRNAFKKALIGARFKLIRDDPTGRYELYDLRADPREQRDLAADEPARVRALVPVLEQRLARIRGPEGPVRSVELDEEQLEALRSLGYLGEE
ncbi:MAG: sulfatase [Proteobacteria bacterium]|nr:sulfatase [Pseudomonadota bacterium]